MVLDCQMTTFCFEWKPDKKPHWIQRTIKCRKKRFYSEPYNGEIVSIASQNFYQTLFHILLLYPTMNHYPSCGHEFWVQFFIYKSPGHVEINLNIRPSKSKWLNLLKNLKRWSLLEWSLLLSRVANHWVLWGNFISHQSHFNGSIFCVFRRTLFDVRIQCQVQ